MEPLAPLPASGRGWGRGQARFQPPASIGYDRFITTIEDSVAMTERVRGDDEQGAVVGD